MNLAMSEPATLPGHLPPPSKMALSPDIALAPEALASEALASERELSAAAKQKAAMLELEHRVAQLENAVADLAAADSQDTQALENRVALKVMERLQRKAPDSERAEYVTPEPPRPSASRQHVSDQESAASSRATSERVKTARDPWLLVDMIASARLWWRMLCDRRHRLAWTTHVVVWVCLAAILLSAIWFPLAWIPFVGSYLDKVLDLLLAYFIYMALSRETRRYRETLAAG